MINKRITQIILLTAGICLIVLTYFIYPKKQDIVLTENKIVKEDETSENTFENISYSGFTPEGELFEIKSKFADIKKDEPDLTYMRDVTTFFYYKENKVITITSDYAIYNKLTSDMFFETNVKMVETEHELTSDNLDYEASENLVTAYNNVKFYNSKNLGFADKVEVDLTEQTSKVSMFDNSLIKLKLTR